MQRTSSTGHWQWLLCKLHACNAAGVKGVSGIELIVIPKVTVGPHDLVRPHRFSCYLQSYCGFGGEGGAPHAPG